MKASQLELQPVDRRRKLMTQSRRGSIVLHENVNAADELFDWKINETDTAKGLVYASPPCLDVSVYPKMWKKPEFESLETLLSC